MARARKVSFVPAKGFNRVELAHRGDHIVVEGDGVVTSDPGEIAVLDACPLVQRGKAQDDGQGEAEEAKPA